MRILRWKGWTYAIKSVNGGTDVPGWTYFHQLFFAFFTLEAKDESRFLPVQFVWVQDVRLAWTVQQKVFLWVSFQFSLKLRSLGSGWSNGSFRVTVHGVLIGLSAMLFLLGWDSFLLNKHWRQHQYRLLLILFGMVVCWECWRFVRTKFWDILDNRGHLEWSRCVESWRVLLFLNALDYCFISRSVFNPLEEGIMMVKWLLRAAVS